MKNTDRIALTQTMDDTGRACCEWSFSLGDEHFGGYCRSEKDAIGDAIHCIIRRTRSEMSIRELADFSGITGEYTRLDAEFAMSRLLRSDVCRK